MEDIRPDAWIEWTYISEPEDGIIRISQNACSIHFTKRTAQELIDELYKWIDQEKE